MTPEYTPPTIEPARCDRCARLINMHRGAVVIQTGRIVEGALRHEPTITLCGWQCALETARKRLT